MASLKAKLIFYGIILPIALGNTFLIFLFTIRKAWKLVKGEKKTKIKKRIPGYERERLGENLLRTAKYNGFIFPERLMTLAMEKREK